MRPMWSDLAFGRMNVCYVGFSIIAFSCCYALVCKRYSSIYPTLGFAVGAILFGSLGALIYPPFIMLLLPFYLATLYWKRDEVSLKRFGYPVLCACISLIFCYDSLHDMASTHLRALDCTGLSCPDAYHRLSLSSLFMREGHDGLSTQGLSIWPVLMIH